jgi:uncharacterized protein YjbI with pentapeptide repeats
MKISNNVKSYVVTILEESCEINGCVFDSTVLVVLRDANQNLIIQQKLGLVNSHIIYEKIRRGEKVELSNCYVKNFSSEEYRKLYGLSKDQKIEITDFTAENAFFEADILTDFSGIVFKGERLSFKNAHFGSGNLSFAHCHFLAFNLDFSNTSYSEGDVVFNFSIFDHPKGMLNFENANFLSGLISFISCDFSNHRIDFKHAQFGHSNLSFQFSVFKKGLLSFDKTLFKGDQIDFSKVDFNHLRVDFKRTDFGTANLVFDESLSKGEKFVFRKCKFTKSHVTFKNADLGDSELVFDESEMEGGIITFLSINAKLISLNNTMLSCYIDLRVEKCESVQLNNSINRDIIDFNVGVSSVSIGNLSFYGIRNLGQILIDWNKNNVRDIISSREDITNAQKAEQFRILKESFNSIGQYEYEDLAYVQFKRFDMKAHYAHLRNETFLKKMVGYAGHYSKKLVFDYMGLFATSPIRVFISTCAVFSLFSLIYYMGSYFDVSQLTCIEGNVSEWERFFDSFYFSAVTFLTIGYGECTPLGFFKAIAPIEAYCGVFMISYFVVSFVRQVLR